MAPNVVGSNPIAHPNFFPMFIARYLSISVRFLYHIAYHKNDHFLALDAVLKALFRRAIAACACAVEGLA